MADAAVEFLLNNLKDLLLHHAHLITGTKKQIQSLETDLLLLNAFLKDTLRRGSRDQTTKVLLRNIRDVAYEAEDVIDAFITQAMEKKESSFFNFWKPSVNLHEIGKKVVEVREKVEKAKLDFADRCVHDEDSYATPEAREPREIDVVGFEDVTNELIMRLTQETDYFDAVSLTGMFGLGKTTLAWKIMNHPDIIYKFPRRIWLSISQEFSARNIFLAILKEFTTINDDDICQRDDREIARMVSDYLESGGCFFIVLDDVWTLADWDKLKVAMPGNNNKGKILITSRIEDVGIYASCPRPPMKLRLFTQDESWKLLQLEALRKLDCPSQLAKIGEMIAKDCNGIPLAIVVIGGILAAKFSASDLSETRKTWEEVSNRVHAYLNEDPQDRMKKFISLSYDRLPHHLRACFLYLGVFPKDHKISATRLIHMWIGEGFIQQKNDTSLEECGETYLHDLINRNLVTILKVKPNGKVKTCKIHDALRDFCRTKAGNENDNFLQEIKSNNEGFSPPIPDLNKYRRLSIHFNFHKFISQKPLGHRVRTFVCFSKDKSTLRSEDTPKLLSAFKLLRVLDVKPIRLTKLCDEMYELIHARYISMSLESQVLPSKFGMLWNTQTLMIDTMHRTLEVRADIWKLSQLRHFKTNASAILPKLNKDSKHGSELQLQTLGTISVESCTVELFERACNLKKLGIRGRLAMLLDGKSESFDSLGRMKHLENLKLVNDVYPGPISDGQLCGLPQASQFPSKLKTLTLVATSLDWTSMSTLGMLVNLEVLKLKDQAFAGKTWSTVDGGFRLLGFLHIEDSDFTIWEASSHHFPRLRGLVLKNCEQLFAIPSGLADIESFHMLDLHDCTSAAASAKEIHEAKKKKTRGEGTVFKFSIFPPID